MEKHPDLHHETYGSLIDGTLSDTQTGRTILITGSGTGIGLATAKAFVKCGAARVLITGRRLHVLEDAKKEIEKEYPSTNGHVIPIATDIGKPTDVEALWEKLKHDGIDVDTLVLNATCFKPGGKLLESKVEEIWENFEVGVHGNWRMTARFAKQGAEQGKVLLNVSSNAVHLNPFITSTYAASKSAMAQLLQHFADEIPADEVRVINYHPGSVYTPAVESGGFPRDAIPWDEPDLPGLFAVWLSTKECTFLHGRYVWANWDIDMLRKLKPKIESDPGVLKLGLQGMPPLSIHQLFEQLNSDGQKQYVDRDYSLQKT